jgi:hypothetical protein
VDAYILDPDVDNTIEVGTNRLCNFSEAAGSKDIFSMIRFNAFLHTLFKMNPNLLIKYTLCDFMSEDLKM